MNQPSPTIFAPHTAEPALPAFDFLGHLRERLGVDHSRATETLQRWLCSYEPGPAALAQSRRQPEDADEPDETEEHEASAQLGVSEDEVRLASLGAANPARSANSWLAERGWASGAAPPR